MPPISFTFFPSTINCSTSRSRMLKGSGGLSSFARYAQVDLPFAHRVNGLYQARSGRTFRHVCYDTRAPARQNIPLLGVHRKDYDLYLRRSLEYLARGVNAVQ